MMSKSGPLGNSRLQEQSVLVSRGHVGPGRVCRHCEYLLPMSEDTLKDIVGLIGQQCCQGTLPFTSRRLPVPIVNRGE